MAPALRTLRTAREDDAAAVLAIYAPAVRDNATSFELELPGVDEVRGRIRDTLLKWPWLVCDGEHGVRGYAYASLHRSRAAYQWCVEVSVYVDGAAQRTGVARALYTALFVILRQQGFVNAYAGITLPNAASVAVHEALGFRPIGVYHAIGFKQGRWHDVGWWELALQEPGPPTGAPLPYAELRDSREHTAALAAGAALLRR